MNKMNEKNKKAGCHCEENFSSTKQSSTPLSNQCFNNIGTTGCNLEDCRVGVLHLLAMTRIGRSLEKIFKKIFRDDLIYFKVAEILGSCFASPRMTKEVAEILGSKLSFCPRMTKEVASIAFGAASQAPCLGSCFASPRMTEKRICPRMTEKWRCLRMTFSILALAAILSFSIASESWAIKCPDNAPNGADSSSNSDYCGVNCCWGITTVTNNDKTEKVLTITPALDSNNKPYTGVTMKDFSSSWSTANQTNGYTSQASSDAPWARKDVTSVVLGNGISNIGKNAFMGDTKITSVTGMENVTSIGESAFNAASSLQSVDMPNVTSIGGQAFYNASSLSYAGFDPKMVTSIVNYVFWGTKINGCSKSNSANCNYCTTSDANSSTPIFQQDAENDPCIAAKDCTGDYELSGNLCKKKPTVAECAAAGKYWQEGECVSSCGASFKLNDGWCDRQRYTPAEAAQWLKDKDNEITITFKK